MDPLFPAAPQEPVRIQLRMSSGPVSPRYQYWLILTLDGAEACARLDTVLKKPGSAEQARTAELPWPRFLALWERWQTLGLRTLPPLAAEEGTSPRRVGAPSNELSVRQGTTPVAGFHFGPSLAEEDASSLRRQLVEDLLDLADSMIAPDFKDLFRADA